MPMEVSTLRPPADRRGAGAIAQVQSDHIQFRQGPTQKTGRFA